MDAHGSERSGHEPAASGGQGRSEEVMGLLWELEHRYMRSRGIVLPSKPAWARALLELPLNLLGRAVGRAVAALGPERFLGLHLGAFRTLAGGLEVPRGPRDAERLAAAAELAGRLRASAGAEPSLWVLLSHPPVDAEVSALNFVLMGRAFEAVRAVRGRASKPRLVAAVDSFALDASPFWQEGLYAGVMSAHHLALDREPGRRGACQRPLLAACRPERAAWRLLRSLSAGEDVAMVLAGGVEPNSRILYVARGLLWRWRRAARRAPAQAARGLGVSGPRAWRRAELAALAALTEGEPSSAESGELGPAAEAALLRLAGALGVEGARPDLAAFREELRRQTPYRERLLGLAARRAARRRPVLLLPLSHGPEGISVGEPAALTSAGALERREGAWSPAGEGFARRWIAANFK